jgi:hypothetical protein
MYFQESDFGSQAMRAGLPAAQQNHGGGVEERGGSGDGAREAPGRSATPIEPDEEALDDPAAQQQGEIHLIRRHAHDLDDDARGVGSPSSAWAVSVNTRSTNGNQLRDERAIPPSRSCMSAGFICRNDVLWSASTGHGLCALWSSPHRSREDRLSRWS